MTDQEQSNRNEGERLVLELGQALHRYGTPAHRIELILERLSENLGLRGRFFAVPTAIFAAFGPLGEQRNAMVRLAPGDVDLGKLARLDEEIKTLVGCTEPSKRGLEKIETIANEAPPYPAWLIVLCFGLASGSAVPFFGGGFLEMAVSSCIGIVLGLVARCFGSGPVRHLFVPLGATIAAALAYGGQRLLGSYHVDVVIVAGLLFLLPGLTLTVALTELSTRHLVSGTARLMAAVLVLLEMAFGVAFGGRLASLIPGIVASSPALPSLPAWTTAAALLIACLSYVVLFRARLRDAVWIIPACAIAFYGAKAGASLLGPQLGAWVGAMSVGLACNAYALALNRPPAVPLVPAILLLVPGSIGLRSMTRLLEQQTLQAVDAAFEMVLVGMGLAVGMLMANVALPPRRDL